MKNQIKLIACLVVTALMVSFASFPTHAGKDKQKAAEALSLPSVDLRFGQDSVPVTGQLVQTRMDDPELSRHFRSYDLIRLDPEAATAQIKNRGRLSLKTSQRDFDLQFTPHDLRAPDYAAQEIGPDGIARKLPKQNFNTFKGIVKGDSRAQARMSVGMKGLEGAIITGTERYFIQPARALSKTARSDEFVFYSIEDVTKTDDSCGVTLAEEVAAREELAAAQSKTEITAELNSPITPLSPMSVVQLATDADSEYVATLGGTSQANAQIVNIMNMVDGIYQVEIGVTFTIVFQNTWTDSATDPYTTTAASALLAEFRNHWNANFGQAVQRDLAHLWTGKDLDGGTIGIASLAVVCRTPTFAYGLSQIFPTTGAVDARTVVLTAHEMGHNFSAAHTNQPTTETPPDFTLVCDNSIMESGLGSSTGSNFCPFSRSQMVGHANAYGSCLSSAGPPPSFNCTEIPIDGTPSAFGSLSNTDCRSTQRGSNHFADQYSFNGVAGQRVIISMVRNGTSFDPYLFLIGPDGFLVSQNDDGGGGVTNSRIPSGLDTIALPTTGKYVIEATSFSAGTTGDYSVFLTLIGCTLSVSPTSQHFSAAAGSGSISVTASGSNCGSSYMFVNSPNTASWLQPQITGGSGTQSLPFNVLANTSSAGRRAFLVVGPSPTDFSGGILIPITQSGTGPDCSVSAIAIGQTLNGNLSLGDCESPIRGTGFFADRYSFTASAGQQVSITTSGGFDTFLNLLGPNGVVLLADDDSGGGTNSRIPGGTGNLPLGVAGTYTIEVTGFDTDDIGSYSLTLTGTAASTPTIQFSSSAYIIGEAGTKADVTVTRSGDTSGTNSVEYITTDTDNFTVNCGNVAGNAFARCDFATSVDTLTFAPGETSKTFAIPIINDSIAEGSETFGVTLSNATGGATLGSPFTTTITITDNESVTGPNPIFTTPFFVRQHYLDFLSREPEAGEPWSGILNSCSDVNNNPACDRLTVSGAFFGSPEFSLKGLFAYRFYKLAFNRLPLYAEIVVDMRTVTGATPAETFQKKATFTNNFVVRTEFINLYNGQTNTQYVNTLMGRYSLTSITTPDPAAPDGTNKVTLTTADLINRLNGVGGTLTRAQVLRAIADSDQVVTAEANQGFVAMQYYGYLRRTPDIGGFNSWINHLNANPTDFRTMVNGFMNSSEYRLRFGPQN